VSLFKRAGAAGRHRTEARDVAIPFGAHRVPIGNTSYADVDLSSAETALQAVAVGSTVDLLASLGAELPGAVYSGSGSDRKQRPTPSYLLDPAGDGYGLEDWKYQVITSWLLRGNVFGDILATSPSGSPTQVAIHHPDEVGAWIDPATGIVHWTVGGRAVDDPAKLLHVRANPVPGRLFGASPIARHADMIGVQMTATRFGLQWFRDGAHPSALLTNEQAELKPSNIEHAKQAFLASLRGTREPLVMGKGWKYQAIQVSAEESQFLATQGYSAPECARIFGPGLAEVLGYETGGSLTYSNRIDRASDLLTFSLNKWLTRLERLIGRMLPASQYYKIDRDALLQMTTLDRYKAHDIALKDSWKVINEVRADEDMPPVEWGDKPMAVQAAEQQAEQADAAAKATGAQDSKSKGGKP
jgi:HK97 family phage portal protein